MKASKIALSLGTILLCSGFLLTSCRKKEDPKPEPEPIQQPAEETGQVGTDSREAQSENDVAMSNINEVISDNSEMSGRPGAAQEQTVNICGLIVDADSSHLGMINLKYNGTTCDNRNRTGTIKLAIMNYALGKKWKDQGTIVRVEYVNYKITRASDQKSMMFNGIQFLTNVSGGNWVNLIWLKNQTSLVTTITGTNLAVTWHDGKTATYNINRRITYTYPNNILTLTCEGLGTQNNLANLENFGISRDGDSFTSQVTTPILWNLTCGGGAPLQGQVNIKVASKNFDLNFLYGVNAQGQSMTVGANQCPYGWKLAWTVNASSASKVVPYY